MSCTNSKDDKELSILNSEENHKTTHLSRCFSLEKSAVISINTNMKSMTREEKLYQWKLLNGKSFNKKTTPMKLVSSRKKSTVKFEDTLRHYPKNHGNSTGRKLENLDGNNTNGGNSNYSGTKYSDNYRDKDLSVSRSRMSYNFTISEKCSINRTLNFGKASTLSNTNILSNQVEDKLKFSLEIEKVYESFEKWLKLKKSDP